MHAQIAFSRFIHHLGSIRIKIRLTWHAFQPPSVTMFCFPLYLHVTGLRSVSTHFISVFNFALFIVGNIAFYNIWEFQFNKLLGLLVFPYSKSLNNPLKNKETPANKQKTPNKHNKTNNNKKTSSNQTLNCVIGREKANIVHFGCPK